MKKNLVLAIAMAFIFNLSNAQTKVKPIKIGQPIPDFTLTQFVNSKLKSFKLSSLKGKVVILDFWSTYCGPCIESLPKYDSLQQKFKGKVVILPVTSENRQKIESFWKSNSYTKRLTLPSVVGTDGLKLSTYFPHGGVPFEVWIDKQGILRGLTSAEYVNEKEIQSMIDDNIPRDWEINRRLEWDNNNSIINRNKMKNISISSISGYIPQTKLGTVHFESDSLRNRCYFINASIGNMYQIVLSRLGYNNSLVFHPQDSSKYFAPYGSVLARKGEYKLDWNRKNTVSYEAILPSTLTEREVNMYLLKDFNKFFKLIGSFEKKSEDYYIIFKMENAERSKFSKSNTAIDTVGLQIENLTQLVTLLNNRDFPFPFKDETNYLDVLNWFVPQEIFKGDLEGLKLLLNRHGFDLRKDRRDRYYYNLSEDKDEF